MMRRAILTFFVVIGVASAACAQDATDVFPMRKFKEPPMPNGKHLTWDYRPMGVTRSAIDGALMRDPKIAAYQKLHSRTPEYAVALADLNGDGKKEIFAKLSDPLGGFCETRDLGDFCLMRVYAAVPTGLVEIAQMITANPVIISDDKTDKVSNIITFETDFKYHVYVWDRSRYKAK